MDTSLWLWSLLSAFLLFWAVGLTTMSMFIISSKKVAIAQRILAFVLMSISIMVVMVNASV